MSEPSRSSIVRFLGVDLHPGPIPYCVRDRSAGAGKHFLYIAAVNSFQEIIFKPLKNTLEKWPPSHPQFRSIRK